MPIDPSDNIMTPVADLSGAATTLATVRLLDAATDLVRELQRLAKQIADEAERQEKKHG